MSAHIFSSHHRDGTDHAYGGVLLEISPSCPFMQQETTLAMASVAQIMSFHLTYPLSPHLQLHVPLTKQ
jgi:hypothetical protein